MNSLSVGLYFKRLTLGILVIAALYSATGFIFSLVDYSKHYDVTIIGRVGYADSMQRQAIDLAKLLDKYLKVNGIVIRSFASNFLSDGILNIFKRGNQLGRVVVFEDTVTTSITGADNDLNEVINSQLFKVFKRNEQIFIAYSMFESTAIPDIWVERLNQQFDMVVVPDPYHIEVYRASGVKIPIFFVPLGVELNRQLQMPLKQQANQKFVYANLGLGRDSKNQLKLLQAFEKVQKLRDNTYLIINSRHNVGMVKADILSYIKSHNIKNVQYTLGRLSPDLYTAMLSKIDCFVYPSKGEGFSIQPREAMAMGIPTIITNNTAHQTICKSGLVECVDAKIERAAYYDIWNDVVIGNNFDCTVDDLATAMLKVYDHYASYLKQSEAARAWAAQYTYDNLKDKYINMVKPRQIILGERNEITDEYLMTNSKALYDKYKAINPL